MLEPSDFAVNEAWIAFRANDSFLLVKNEPYDVYILLDAASTYVMSGRKPYLSFKSHGY